MRFLKLLLQQSKYLTFLYNEREEPHAIIMKQRSGMLERNFCLQNRNYRKIFSFPDV